MPSAKTVSEEKREVRRRRETALKRRKSDERRFNVPLKLFIQRKYKTIYNEYKELYVRMTTEVPPKKNLCATLTFKQFLKDHPDEQEQEQDQGNEQEGQEQGNERVMYVPHISLRPVEEEVADMIQQEDPDILTQALVGALVTDPSELNPPEYDLRVEEVHTILEEMSKSINFDIAPVDEGLQDIEYFDSFEKDVQLFNHS